MYEIANIISQLCGNQFKNVRIEQISLRVVDGHSTLSDCGACTKAQHCDETLGFISANGRERQPIFARSHDYVAYLIRCGLLHAGFVFTSNTLPEGLSK